MQLDGGYLYDIVRQAHTALGLVGGKTFQEFQYDYECRRCVQAIAEAAGRLSETFRKAHPDVPWTRIIEMGNRLQDPLRLDAVLRFVQKDLPDVIRALEGLLPPPEDER